MRKKLVDGFTNMTPVVVDDLPGMYRTPVLEQSYSDVTYTVWPADKFSRVLTSNDMPKEMKLKLGMVKAYDGAMKKPSLQNWHLSVMPTLVYETTYPDFYNDIGWRVTESAYCLVLGNQTLMELKGNYDTGSESKKESS
jgi:hypothetical protein